MKVPPVPGPIPTPAFPPLSIGERPVPRVRWATFLNRWEWKQGEHVTIIGPTDYGKTTLSIELLDLRDYVVFFATKPRDSTLDALAERGYYRTSDWPPPPIIRQTETDDRTPTRIHPFLRPIGQRDDPPDLDELPEVVTEPQPRVLLWPDATDLDRSQDIQRSVFESALREIFVQGGYCVFFDETLYMVEQLGMERTLRKFWQQGRSLGISVVSAAQRPRDIPLFAYDQATHLFIGHNRDAYSQRRLGEIGGGIDGAEIARVVADIPKHWWLYVDTRSGETSLLNVRW